MALGLDDDLVGAVGEGPAKTLKRVFKLATVGDLLGHYPRRYLKHGELTPIDELPLGDDVTIVAEVLQSTSRTMRQRRGTITEVVVTDGRGRLSLTFFGRASWHEHEFAPGTRAVFSGKVTRYNNQLQLTHPVYEKLEALSGADAEDDDAAAARWADAPIPIYPASASMTTSAIGALMRRVLDALGPVPEVLPDEVRTARGLVGRGDALRMLHRPRTEDDWRIAREALRFEEAFVLQAALLAQRAALRAEAATARPAKVGGLLDALDAKLPFTLTPDQQRVGAEIAAEVASALPMHRLVQGEVGSGKTLVALRAMLQVIDAGGQAAMLAPTEVLAAQHLRSIVGLLGPDLAARVNPVLLTGQVSQAERRRTTLALVSGQANLVVGTHALITGRTDFYDLGLIVVDEQHRFGVEQREALRAKAVHPPHMLVLTATPIPRTVAMTVFGDLDVSTVRTMPAGRAGIESFVIPLADKPAWIGRVWQRTAEELAKGRQAFVVCAAIDEQAPSADEGPELADDPDAVDAPQRPPLITVAAAVAQLRERPEFAGRRIEPLHGRMGAEEKDQIMRAFAAGDIDVLVSTTVIEVGVDVPNASTMIVLDADRFGVSQLHQLRGRIGRGGVPGIAFFVTPSFEGTLARERVEAVAGTLDGFELAQADLELRREGDVLGSTQSGGRSSLKLLKVVHDADVIDDARAAAAAVVDADPTLAAHPSLAAELDRLLPGDAGAFLRRG